MMADRSLERDSDPPDSPASFEAVREKIRGSALTADAIERIVRDIVALRYSDRENAAFLVACADAMAPDEVLALTRAMAMAGDRLRWPGETVVDIHSVGGVPGNRVSMIVVPIVAAHGLTIPKTSSRAITSPAGTADAMEVLACVNLARDEIRRVVEENSGCLVWSGGRANLSPADDILISVERVLSLDAPGQLVASILSKKSAAGITHLLIEIPVGPTAKVRGEAGARRLRELFAFVAGRLQLTIDFIETDAAAPIGRGIGPALEARDVIQVLRGAPNAPEDLRARALAMAGRMLEFDPTVRSGTGLACARTLLDSGVALRKMQAILAAQGEPPAKILPPRFAREVLADRTGEIAAIDCARITQLAVRAGAPIDKPAGLDLFRLVGERVAAGEPLYRIDADSEACLERTLIAAASDNGYRIRAA